MYPELKSYFNNADKSSSGSGNIRKLNNNIGVENGSWENSDDNGDNIVEYMNEEGTYIVHPASGKIVDFVPNPLQSGPAFVVAKDSALTNYKTV